MNSEETVKTGCFGPSRVAQTSIYHGRSSSRGSILQKFWPSGGGGGGAVEQGDSPELQLESLADDLLMLGFDVDIDKKRSLHDKCTNGDGETIDVNGSMESGLKFAMSKHERKRSWPFSVGRRVVPEVEARSKAGMAPDLSCISSSSDVNSSDNSNHGSPVAQGSTNAGDNGAPHTQNNSGYRKLWQSITSVRKGDKIGASGVVSLTAAPHDFTVETLVKKVLALKSSQSILDATQLKEGLRVLDSRAVAALLKELAKAGAPNRAGELFDYLRSLPEEDELACLADLYTYTTIISQCGAHQYLRRALELVAEMRSRGIQANIHTYSALMSVCVKCNECQLALDVYEQLQSEGLVPNMVTYNILIDAYARTGQWKVAADLLDPIAEQGLQPEARTYNAIIAACGKAGQPSAAKQVYDRMLSDGVEPTGTTYTSIISAFGKAGQVDEAIKIYREMSMRGCEPNVITYSSLISVCERAGRVDDALRLFSEMRKAGVRPNVVTFNALVAACAGACMWQQAAELFDSMGSAGCRPDGGTFSALMSAYERAGQWRSVLQTMEKMQSMHMRPDAGAFNCALGALWDSGRLPALRKAVILFSSAQRQGALRFQSISAGEVTCTAYSTGTVVLVTLRWLANFRDGLAAGAFGAAQPSDRALLLTKSKHAPWNHSFESVCKSLKLMFDAFSIPASASIVQKGLEIRSNAEMLPAWTVSPSGLALLSMLDIGNNSMGNLPGLAAMIREDKSGELQCSKAFAAVRDFEARRSLHFGLEAWETLHLSGVASARRDFVACLSALSNALKLREEVTHDAVQLCDMMLVATPLVNLPPALESAAALLLTALRQTGEAGIILRQGQMVLQAAGLPLSTILETEHRVQTILGKSPAAISPLRVLQLFLERLGCEMSSLQKCQFLQVMALSATDFVSKAALSPTTSQFDPSIVAAACLIKARESIGLSPSWPSSLRDMTGFEGPERPDIARCLKYLNVLLASV